MGIPFLKEVSHNVKADPHIRIYHVKSLSNFYLNHAHTHANLVSEFTDGNFPSLKQYCGTNSRLLHHAGGLLINPTWACTKSTWCQQLLIHE